MSIFSKWMYQCLKFYNMGIIMYEVRIKKRLIELYRNVYSNSIVEIVKYDTRDLMKTCILQNTLLDMMKHVYAYNQANESYKSRNFETQHTMPIYEITCWDNRKYLTRSHFDVGERVVSRKRHICLHASMNDQLDVTDFVNQHKESFTLINHITPRDILCIYFINQCIDNDLFYKIIFDENMFMYIIDDETLEVRTFKDNQAIIL